MEVQELRSDSETYLVRLRSFCTDRSPFLLVFVPLALIYLATASYASFDHIDPLTNAVTGWHLGLRGSVTLPDHAEASVPEQRGNVAWIVDSPRGPVSQYPPGAAALSAPFYRLWDAPMTEWYVEGSNKPDVEPISFPLPSPAPAAVAASLATAAAMGLLALAVPHAGGTRFAGVTAGYVGGLGTTMWSIASDELWQHGPAALWIALGLYLAARSRLLWSGLAFGAAILTRPPVAIIAAVLGLYLSVSRRDPKPALEIGAGSLVGLVALMTYNWWVWGELSLSGGYGSQFGARLATPDLMSYVENVVGAMVDPLHGLFIYSAFLLVLIPGLRAGWRRSPDWVRGAALGGILYLLVHLKINRFSGGDGFLGYRYPLETLTAAGVLLSMSYSAWVEQRPMVRRLFWLAVLISVAPQVYWQLVYSA